MTINPAALGALAAGDIENFMAAATPGGIEAQERAGQQALVASTKMPISLRCGYEQDGRAMFEQIGFTFGTAIDDVFQEATLPAGWSKKASDHDMWSYIHDEHGRERVSVFYKAAFYDRSAHATLGRRYTYSTDYSEGRKYPHSMTSAVVIDKGDGDKILARFGDYKMDDFKADEKHLKEAEAWLGEHYPNWEDPTAYW